MTPSVFWVIFSGKDIKTAIIIKTIFKRKHKIQLVIDF
jgi:hypothetical protein